MTTMLPPLPVALIQRGGSPDLIKDELLGRIRHAIQHHPRSQQTAIGPSEVGIPCARRLGYKLLGFPERDDKPNWKATVGTAGHAWLEDVFHGDNMALVSLPQNEGAERWLLETRVHTGDYNGKPVDGSCDLYDRVTATVVDWKFVGPTQLKKYRSKGASEQYRTQAHLYGRGFQQAGLPVDTVMVVFLPRDGELHDTHVWHEPYDEQVAIDALSRLAGIDLAVQALGPAALSALPTADAYCTFCPFYKVQSTDLTEGCPGHPSGQQQTRRDQILDLI